jgi:hypothetical protein
MATHGVILPLRSSAVAGYPPLTDRFRHGSGPR